MDYKIREIRENEYPILSDFLYEAIFIPEGMDKPPKSIIEQLELQVYNEKTGLYGECHILWKNKQLCGNI